MSKYYSNDFSMTDEKIEAIFADLHRRVEEDRERREINAFLWDGVKAVATVFAISLILTLTA